MPRYTKESLSDLRSKIDLVEVLEQHIQLKRAGASYKALCPFHDEKTPSFTLQKGDSHYHCFGCGAHGDAIQFLMQHLKLSFTDAVQNLAERFHVELQEASGTHEEKRTSRGRLKEALDAACSFYQFLLLYTKEGQEALSYLYERGISLEFITSFRLGLSPASEGLFRKYMRQKGFFDEVLEDAGLLTERTGKLREFFLERITFPILDAQGAVIGFSARKFREKTFGGKYINTQETELFKKSKVLFGLHHSRKRIAKEKQVIVVEGQLDCLRLIFNGYDYTVAGQGTAFGESHVRELIQLGITKAYLLLDGDEAGRNAAVKIGHLFQKEGVDVYVAMLEDGQDPDSVLVQHGPLAILTLLQDAEEYLTYLFQHLAKEVNLNSPASKNGLIQEMAKRIRDWNNAVMVHESLKKLASLADVPDEILGAATRVAPNMQIKRIQFFGKEEVDPDKILEGDLLRWLIVCGNDNAKLYDLCKVNLTSTSFRNPLARLLYDYLLKCYEEKRPFDFLELAAEVEGEEANSFLSSILGRKVNREKAHLLIEETIVRIKERNWLFEREQIRQKIQSGTLSEEEVHELVKKFDEVKKCAPKLISIGSEQK
jgi:DNA primase